MLSEELHVRRPVLEENDPALVSLLDKRFAALEKELNQYQQEDGSWTSYDKLTKAQIKRLSDAVAAVSEPTSQVAGVVSESV